VLRIVGGRLSGRRFAGPKDTDARPTAERVREALGSILEARGAIEGATVLDLYAGTGALGFEMLSRGAASAVLVDRRSSTRAIRQNADTLGLDVRVIELDLTRRAEVRKRLGELGPFSLVLADPPYRDAASAATLLAALARDGVFSAGAFVVLEHAARDAPFDEAEAGQAGLAIAGRYRYGDTALAVFSYDGADRV
jgi:16S rRNA (guanine966-N2)-methyltransferase